MPRIKTLSERIADNEVVEVSPENIDEALISASAPHPTLPNVWVPAYVKRGDIGGATKATEVANDGDAFPGAKVSDALASAKTQIDEANTTASEAEQSASDAVAAVASKASQAALDQEISDREAAISNEVSARNLALANKANVDGSNLGAGAVGLAALGEDVIASLAGGLDPAKFIGNITALDDDLEDPSTNEGFWYFVVGVSGEMTGANPPADDVDDGSYVFSDGSSYQVKAPTPTIIPDRTIGINKVSSSLVSEIDNVGLVYPRSDTDNLFPDPEFLYLQSDIWAQSGGIVLDKVYINGEPCISATSPVVSVRSFYIDSIDRDLISGDLVSFSVIVKSKTGSASDMNVTLQQKDSEGTTIDEVIIPVPASVSDTIIASYDIDILEACESFRYLFRTTNEETIVYSRPMLSASRIPQYRPPDLDAALKVVDTLDRDATPVDNIGIDEGQRAVNQLPQPLFDDLTNGFWEGTYLPPEVAIKNGRTCLKCFSDSNFIRNTISYFRRSDFDGDSAYLTVFCEGFEGSGSMSTEVSLVQHDSDGVEITRETAKVRAINRVQKISISAAIDETCAVLRVNLGASQNKNFFYSRLSLRSEALSDYDQYPLLDSRYVKKSEVTIPERPRLYVPLPEWWTYDVGVKVWHSDQNRYETDFNPDDYRPAQGDRWYYDPLYGKAATGSIANRGWFEAADRLSDLIDKINALEVESATIYLRPGMDYDVTKTGAGRTVNFDLSLICPDGEATLSVHSLGEWSKTDGLDNVYDYTKASGSAPSHIIDLTDIDDRWNTPKRLHQATTAEECDETPGSFFIDGMASYVHLFDAREPDDDVRIFVNVHCLQMGEGKSLWAKNVNFWGGNPPIYFRGSDTGILVLDNCDVMYAHNQAAGGLRAMGNRGSKSYARNCRAIFNGRDGFNYHNQVSGAGMDAYEERCIGVSNGYEFSLTSHNGSTIHDGGRVMRVACDFFYNDNKNLHDIGNGESVNIGCRSGIVKNLGDANAANFMFGSTGGGDATKGYLYDCKSLGGSPNDFVVEIGSLMQVRSTDIVNVTNNITNGTLERV